jgi:hypothetical protein
VSVCVDPLRKWTCGIGRGITRGKTCHLFTDNGDLESLHDLAASIDLRREWFQDDDLPHYDLVPSKRALAIRAGAVEVDRRYAIWVRKGGGK